MANNNEVEGEENKTEIETADKITDAKRITYALSEFLKLYIHDKEQKLRSELRDGGRHLTWRKLANPMSLIQYLGGLSKNPDHAEAYDQRLTLIVYANYLTSRLANLEAEKNNPTYLNEVAHLMEEVSDIKNYLIEKEYKGPLVLLLQNISASATKLNLNETPTLPAAEQEEKRQFRLLWPFYLVNRDPGELYNNANFSAERAYAIAKDRNININKMSENDYSQLFTELNNDYKKDPFLKHQLLRKIRIKFTDSQLGFSDHAKMVIVDNKDLYMGGLDLAKGRSDKKTWHDCHCHIKKSENAKQGSTVIDDAQELFDSRFNLKRDVFTKTKVITRASMMSGLFSSKPVNAVASKQKSKPLVSPQKEDSTKSMQLLTSIRKEYFDPLSKNRPDYSWHDNTHNKELAYSQAEAIQKAEKFIYMESQFFIGPHVNRKNNKIVAGHNLIIDALLDKIKQKIERGEEFHFYCQLPFRPEGKHDEIAVEIILRKQWNTMEYFIEEVNKSIRDYNDSHPDQKNVSDYITFSNLGCNQPEKTSENGYEMKYTHSKLMILDDDVAFIGSNNCNERSNKGSRDHEICMKIKGYPEIKDYRQKLMAEQLGINHEELARFESAGNTPQKKDYINFVHQKLDGNLAKLSASSAPIATSWGNIDRAKLEKGERPPHVPKQTARHVAAVQAVSPWANKLVR